MSLQLLEKQLDGDIDLLRTKLQRIEEEVGALRVLIDRVEIAVKHQLRMGDQHG